MSLAPAPAHADVCDSSAGLSPCFDADQLWIAPGRARYLSIPDTAALTEPGGVSLGMSVGVLHGPVILNVDSPDRGGRDIHVVDTAFDASLLLSLGVVDAIDMDLALPVRLHQSGSGIGAVTSQTSAPLTSSALQDPRLGFAYSFDHALSVPWFGAKLAFDVSIPLGNEQAFAGERSFAASPSTVLAFRGPRVQGTFLLGLRLRRPTEFGGVRVGSQGVIGLGGSVDVLDSGLVFASLELFALPSLVEEHDVLARSNVADREVFPAEWLLSVSARPSVSSPFTFTLGGGTGLPLSSDTVRTPSGGATEHFLGLPTPQYRVLALVRYAAAAAAPPETSSLE